MIKEILDKLQIENIKNIIRIKSVEDNAEYNVWKIETLNKNLLLKETKSNEYEIYKEFLSVLDLAVPKIYSQMNYKDKHYILTEFIEGTDLCKSNRTNLIKVLDSLIYITNVYWNNNIKDNIGYTYKKSLESRIDRGKYLPADIKIYYDKFIECYNSTTKTFCHDDLLPFNVIVNDSAYLIDWEHAGILPYPTPLVRLIAHGKDDPKYIFYMTDEDKNFAIEYFYKHCIKYHNVNYDEYIKTINLFLVYEYSEWIMLGNKYENTNTERYNYYIDLCRKHISCNLK